jgi:Zn-dependent peptidase ImmA (M78 family)
MRNRFLSERQRAEIDGQISKILRGLGNPDPPLDLEQVRTLLRLDVGYYSSTDDGALREFVSRVRVAGKLFIERPTRILDVVRKFDLKALFVPEGQRILLDSAQPEIKWRWNEAHEVIHSVLPHHQALMHGDDLFNLNPSCHVEIEHEANYGAGRLLFFQDRFTEFALGAGRPTFAVVKAAQREFGNTMTSSLWRLVEALDVPALGMVGPHPKYRDHSAEVCKYFIRSRAFEAEFSRVSETDVLSIIRGYAKWSKRGPLGSSEAVMRDDNGDEHLFMFDTFYNGHEALTLAVFARRRPTVCVSAASGTMP